MNLEIPKKFKPVIDAARGAAKTIFRPISRKYDVHEHDYPKELDLLAAALQGMADAGQSLGGASGNRGRKDESNVSVKNGGNMSSVLNIMQMCYGDVGLLLTIPGQGLGNAAIAAVANDEQMKRLGKKWAAMAITEPGAGSDSAAIKATAIKDGDEYVLNATKIFVTAGERADCVVVWASVDPSKGRAAIKSFVVEKGTPGMKVERLETKMGIRASDTAVISFTDCRVPANNLLGSPEVNVQKGFAGVMETFDNTRPFVAAMAVGVAEAALERTKELLKERLSLNYTSPINNLSAIESEICKLESDYEAARLLTIKAAWMADNRIPNSVEASISKAKAGRVGSRITLKCVELCTSMGYSEAELIEKWARDSKILDIFEGTQQIQQLIIARRTLGLSSKELK